MKVQLALTTLVALSSAVALKPRDDDDDRRQVAPAAASVATTTTAPLAAAPTGRPDDCTDDDDDDRNDPRCVAPAPATVAPGTTPAPGQAQPTGRRGDDDNDGDDDDDDDCYDDGNDRFRSEIPACAGRNTRTPGQPRPSTSATPFPGVPGNRDDDDDDDDDDCYDDGNDRFRSEVPGCVGRNTRVPGAPRPTTTPIGAAPVPVGTTGGAVTSTTRAANVTATRTGAVTSFTGGAVPAHNANGFVGAAVIAVAGLLAF